jgi:hypothetical protein
MVWLAFMATGPFCGESSGGFNLKNRRIRESMSLEINLKNRTSNIEHRTSNAEVPAGSALEPSAFDVQCSTFDVRSGLGGEPTKQNLLEFLSS